MSEERPKRSDQLPEEAPESVVPDDVPPGDPQSAEAELRESPGAGEVGSSGRG